MKMAVALALAIVVVILTFTLMPTPADAEDITQGFSNTRQYATSNTYLSVSVDTYNGVIEQKRANDEAVAEIEVANIPGLGEYGKILDHADYEKYTENIKISNNKDILMSMDEPATDVRSAKASFTDVYNYMTYDNEPGNGVSDTTDDIFIYLGYQCRAFSNFYVNQVSYKDYVKSRDDIIVSNVNYILNGELLETLGTAWVADTNVSFRYNPDAAKKFFYKLTPGTFISTAGHSYIIIGMDNDHVITYDANNSNGLSEIKLIDWDWKSLCDSWCYASNIKLIIAPPGGTLPAGCLVTGPDQQGHIATTADTHEWG